MDVDSCEYSVLSSFGIVIKDFLSMTRDYDFPCPLR